ncbi:MAG: hypothetical protein COU25_01910 [Candidatus Levybacteria bacterium CG10_big_fil_rev_8_21_14_0_10_35_13]|nr:MAG: hypothetical protein COU25_01910 [Candidatus Levybacteria bacterium CG10_big_fil_rev_8_21_14_0_10_35_13]
MSLKKQAIQTALNGDWQNAILLNKDLIKENPGDLDALNRLALAYAITGKINLAKSTYLKVVKLDPLNSIALRNLKKIKEKSLKTNSNSKYYINNKFLEEPGKTKVIELVNIAQPKVLEQLRTGQYVNLSIKRLKIFVLDDKQYIGVLPDDIGKRLIKFIKGDCQYEAYAKSANAHKVTIFIKELKKSSRYRNQPSFMSSTETALVLDKVKKGREFVNSGANKPSNSEDSYFED